VPEPSIFVHWLTKTSSAGQSIVSSRHDPFGVRPQVPEGCHYQSPIAGPDRPTYAFMTWTTKGLK
jgi:hypothetical protein